MPAFFSVDARPTKTVAILLLGVGSMFGTACLTGGGRVAAQEQQSSAPKYSEAVVAKADKILEDAGLRRAGKTIQPTELSEIGRAITSLTRDKRELRLLHQDWKKFDDALIALRRQQQQLSAQYGELNLQLARVAGVDVAANNKIVGLLNATTTQMELLRNRREAMKDEMTAKRELLNNAESQYAETVLAIRRDYNSLYEEVAKALGNKDVQTALQVSHVNFETPKDLTADEILGSLDSRIERIEQEIFSESIELDVENGSLYVNVVVGKETTRMVVDSGATLVTLPAHTADKLGVTVPSDAPQLQLVLADGRTIGARGVTLEKVRVGEFEVENVEAAVLDATASQAEPLLGMTFLGNFKSELDPASGTLKLLRVATE